MRATILKDLRRKTVQRIQNRLTPVIVIYSVSRHDTTNDWINTNDHTRHFTESQWPISGTSDTRSQPR